MSLKAAILEILSNYTSDQKLSFLVLSVTLIYSCCMQNSSPPMRTFESDTRINQELEDDIGRYVKLCPFKSKIWEYENFFCLK